MQLIMILQIALLAASPAIASPHIRPRVAEPGSTSPIDIFDPETANSTTQGSNTQPEPILPFPTGAIGPEIPFPPLQASAVDPETPFPTLKPGGSPTDTSSVF